MVHPNKIEFFSTFMFSRPPNPEHLPPPMTFDIEMDSQLLIFGIEMGSQLLIFGIEMGSQLLIFGLGYLV